MILAICKCEILLLISEIRFSLPPVFFIQVYAEINQFACWNHKNGVLLYQATLLVFLERSGNNYWALNVLKQLHLRPSGSILIKTAHEVRIINMTLI